MDSPPDIVTISLLGPLEVRRGSVDVTPTAQRERIILSLLALDPQGAASVPRLVEAMWGDEPPETARNSIQVAISRLRHRLDGDRGRSNLVSTPSGYALRGATVDAHRFDAAYRSILAVQRAAAVDPEQQTSAVREALALWRDRTVLVDLHGSMEVLVHARQLERKRLELVELLGSMLVEVDPAGAVDAVEHDARLEWGRPLLQLVYLRALLEGGLRRDARDWCDRLERTYAAERTRMDERLADLIERIRANEPLVGRDRP